ncbi:ATP-binding protein [Anaerovorax odorimutans]|uniref:ATP-binding protein n=1 Tax=Anaerovorax odorimutans TaxID=109327 RepID=UPI0003F7493B|nr:ATP-binding protein [Anaerovorax odorimutans]
MTITSSLIEKRDKKEITQNEFKETYEKLRKERDKEELLEMEIEWKAERLKRLLKNSDLGSRFQTRTFKNFKTDKHNESIYEKCFQFAKHFEEIKTTGKGLLFIGNVGTGKTHLAAAIANYIIKEYILLVKFGSVTSLLNEIKNTYESSSEETELQVIKELSNVDLLVIDDLGKEKASEWSNSVIYTIINNRYEGYKPLIVTTNLKIEELEKKLGEAVVSRLIEMCDGIKMDGIDYRKVKLIKEV